MSFKADAPGSLMLLGEYAVLQGKQAIVCAVDKRITVILTPRSDDKIEIHSSLFGHYAGQLSTLQIEKPFQFVLGALLQLKSKLRRGCDIQIETTCSDKMGLGSSAAVLVATLAAIVSWQNIRISPIELIRLGRNVVRGVQGVGSGADVAASVMGGIVAYQPQPLSAEKFSLTHPLTALYAGYKTPTVDAIKQVQQTFHPYPVLLRSINQSIAQCVLEGVQCLRRGDWDHFGKVMTIQQGMMKALGVSTPQLCEMVAHLQQQPEMLGAKISGSGLGDCVIGLGALSEDCCERVAPAQYIPVEMTLQGVQCEKI